MSGLGGYDANLRDLRARRVAVEQEQREAAVSRFSTRADAARIREVDPDDRSGEIVRLEAALREWDLANPELSAEVASFERSNA